MEYDTFKCKSVSFEIPEDNHACGYGMTTPCPT